MTRTLEDDLDALGQKVAAFVELLRREAEILRAPEADALTEIVTRKGELAAEMNAAWETFAARVSAPPLSLDRVRQALPRFPHLQRRWQNVCQLAEEATRLNQANGALIELQRQRTQRALEVLQTAANPAQVYGEHGRILDLFGPSRTLDKA